jgi:peptidoglycan/LPS O-acetylase OafA/YrhL
MSEESLQRPALKYRPEIDGLRAVAVVIVILYHLEIRYIPGGFVGVDVFFVISGYLISSIIFSEIAAARFSITAFYERRIRRIFPALFAMLFAFTAFAFFYILPAELVGYAKSLLAAATSVSNIYFWQHSGYFDSPLSNPLLHTWSLAVEEQFYIFFPLFLWLVRRVLPRQLKSAVVALFFTSLLISAGLVFYSRNAAFYMPYSRAWELLLGTMLSLGMFPRLASGWARNIATIAGAALIAVSACLYTGQTPFPGLAALLPCIGSALIIGAGESGSSLVGAALSWRPVVFIGLISYSLYLWHWPIIILHKMGFLLSLNTTVPARYLHSMNFRHYDMGVEAGISLLLAILSWRFVERPFRSGALRLSGRPLFALAGGTVALILAVSIAMIAGDGFTFRFPPRAVQVASYIGNRDIEPAMRSGTCFVGAEVPFKEFRQDICLQQAVGKKNYLLLGDSHSAALWYAISTSLPDVNLMQAGVSGCEPILDSPGSANCKDMMRYIYESYLPAHHVDALLLEARWGLPDMDLLTKSIASAKRLGIPVIVFGPVQDYDAPLPRLLAYSISWNQPELPAQHRMTGDALDDAKMEELAANTWHVPYLSLYKAICNNGVCAEYADEAHQVPLMFDADHLSVPGSLLIVRRLIANGQLR